MQARIMTQANSRNWHLLEEWREPGVPVVLRGLHHSSLNRVVDVHWACASRNPDCQRSVIRLTAAALPVGWVLASDSGEGMSACHMRCGFCMSLR